MASASLLYRDDIHSPRTEELGPYRSPSAIDESRRALRVLLAVGATSPNAEQAIEPLAFTNRVRVDVVHVVKPGGLTRQTWRRLHRTLAGCSRATVDHYVIEDSDPAAGIARFCSSRACDLIMAPASGCHVLWLPWRRSMRAAILRRSPVPVWTTGATRPGLPPGRQISRVGCCVSLETGGDAHLRWASDFSQRVGARLHLLHVVAPLDDGSIADAFESDRPLLPAVAHERVQALLADGIDAEAEIVVGAHSRELRRLVRSRSIDVLCVSSRAALCGRQISPALLALPCSVVCCQ